MEVCLSCGACLSNFQYSDVYACPSCILNAQSSSETEESFRSRGIKSPVKRGVRFNEDRDSKPTPKAPVLSNLRNIASQKPFISNPSVHPPQILKKTDTEFQRLGVGSSRSNPKKALVQQLYDEDQSMPHSPPKDSTADTFAPVSRQGSDYRMPDAYP